MNRTRTQKMRFWNQRPNPNVGIQWPVQPDTKPKWLPARMRTRKGTAIMRSSSKRGIEGAEHDECVSRQKRKRLNANDAPLSDDLPLRLVQPGFCLHRARTLAGASGLMILLSGMQMPGSSGRDWRRPMPRARPRRPAPGTSRRALRAVRPIRRPAGTSPRHPANPAT